MSKLAYDFYQSCLNESEKDLNKIIQTCLNIKKFPVKVSCRKAH
jgi:hypothetical protein